MITKDKLTEDLKRVKELIGRIPTNDEYLSNGGKYGRTTFTRKFGTWNKALTEIFGETVVRTKVILENKQCICCNNLFAPNFRDQKYCSYSCANEHSPRRSKTKKCRECGSLIQSKYTFCEKCIDIGKHLNGGKFVEDKTLQDLLMQRNDANKYSAVRNCAKKVTKNITACEFCGYSNHVETCHIKPVCEFNLTDKISLINSIDNLVVLCPNHHWEFDNKILTLEEIKNKKSN